MEKREKKSSKTRSLDNKVNQNSLTIGVLIAPFEVTYIDSGANVKGHEVAVG